MIAAIKLEKRYWQHSTIARHSVPYSSHSGTDVPEMLPVIKIDCSVSFIAAPRGLPRRHGIDRPYDDILRVTPPERGQHAAH
jgi:hypothetical protein